jgi:hypothetical protein
MLNTVTFKNTLHYFCTVHFAKISLTSSYFLTIYCSEATTNSKAGIHKLKIKKELKTRNIILLKF